MASKHFDTHHRAAKQAHDAGDHAKAMHHIGHMMRAVRSAQKAMPVMPPGSAPNEDQSPTDADDDAAPIATSPGVPKKGFNRWIFGAMKGGT